MPDWTPPTSQVVSWSPEDPSPEGGPRGLGDHGPLHARPPAAAHPVAALCGRLAWVMAGFPWGRDEAWAKALSQILGI